MKIKTLTTHNIYNYGASLQAYALHQYLSNLGHDVEIINFRPEYSLRRYDYTYVNPEWKFHKYAIARFIYKKIKYLQRLSTLKRKANFDNFTNQYIKATEKEYRNNDELKQDTPIADAYIVGSDQVWNSFYDRGKDPASYLDFAPNNAKCISYAASFSITEIDKANVPFVKQMLKKFNFISVREKHGLSILEQLGFNGTWVLDPVFLLPVEDWKVMMTPFKKKENYLLVYDFERNAAVKKFAKQYAKQKGLKIYAVTDTHPLLYAYKNFNAAGSCEFLSLIYNCDCFISNSFHGSVFSIIFNRPFFIFGRNKHKVNSRMESLLDMFELSDRYISDFNDLSVIDEEIDYDKVNQIKEQFLIKSKSFLQESLS